MSLKRWAHGYTRQSESDHRGKRLHTGGDRAEGGLTPAKLSGILNKSRKLEANEMLALCAALKIDPLYLIRYHEEEPANTP